MEVHSTITMSAQPAGRGGKRPNKKKAPNNPDAGGSGQPQNAPPGQNPNQQQQQQQQQQSGQRNPTGPKPASSGAAGKRGGGNQNNPQHQQRPYQPRPPYQNQNHPPHGGKTGLGLGEGKKYDQNACLFISNVDLKEGESALKYVDNLLIDRMNLDFRALEVKKLEMSTSSDKDKLPGGAKYLPPPLFAAEEKKTVVAIMGNPAHVQEVLRKSDGFKNSPENFEKYGTIEFEGYLTVKEQSLKAAMIKRVDELNQLMRRARIGPESTELQAKVLSKNSYKHLGLEYRGDFQGDNTIVWKSFQNLPKSGQNKGPNPKGKGPAVSGGGAGEGKGPGPSGGQVQQQQKEDGDVNEFTLI